MIWLIFYVRNYTLTSSTVSKDVNPSSKVVFNIYLTSDGSDITVTRSGGENPKGIEFEDVSFDDYC